MREVKLFKKLVEQRRAFFYSTAIAISLFLLLLLKTNQQELKFVIYSMFPLYILLFEFYSSRRKYLFEMGQLKLQSRNVSYLQTKGVLVHHLILPTILLAGTLGFIYFNASSLANLGLIALCYFCYFILFENFKFLYSNNFVYERKTHYIFDLIKLVSFFLFTNLLFHLYDIGLSKIILLILLGITVLLFFMFEVLRREQANSTVMIFVGASTTATIILTFVLMTFMNLNNIELSAITFSCYYLLGAILHHKLSGTFTTKVLTEYAIMSTLLITVVFFLE